MDMPPKGEPALETIARALTPFLGATMARAAIEVNKKKLGLKGPDIAPANVDRLLDELRPGLRVYLGAVQTGRVIEVIRNALASSGGTT
jgi:hypothetical protein